MQTGLILCLIMAVVYATANSTADSTDKPEWESKFDKIFTRNLPQRPEVTLEQLQKLITLFQADGNGGAKLLKGCKDAEHLMEIARVDVSKSLKSSAWITLERALVNYADFVHIYPFLVTIKRRMNRLIYSTYLERLLDAVNGLSGLDKAVVKALRKCVLSGAEWLDDTLFSTEIVPDEYLIRGILCAMENHFGRMNKARYENGALEFRRELRDNILLPVAQVELKLRAANKLYERIRDPQAFKQDLFWGLIREWQNNYNLLYRLTVLGADPIFAALPE